MQTHNLIKLVPTHGLISESKVTRRLPFQKLLHRDEGEGATPFPGFLHFTFDPYLKLSKVASSTIFFNLSYYLGLNPGLPDHWRTLYSLGQSPGYINNLNKLDIKIFLPSKTIRDLVHSYPQRNIFSDADVYCIPCINCKSKHIGETTRNLHIR